MALATLNYSRFCYDYSIYSDINREINKDVNKKEVYNVLIFQYFEVRHMSSAATFPPVQSQSSKSKYYSRILAI